MANCKWKGKSFRWMYVLGLILGFEMEACAIPFYVQQTLLHVSTSFLQRVSTKYFTYYESAIVHADTSNNKLFILKKIKNLLIPWDNNTGVVSTFILQKA